MKISKNNKMREDLLRKRRRALGITKGKYNFKGWFLFFSMFYCFLSFFLLISETKICNLLASIRISMAG